MELLTIIMSSKLSTLKISLSLWQALVHIIELQLMTKYARERRLAYTSSHPILVFFRKNRRFFNDAACLTAWSVWGASDIGSLPVPYYARIRDSNLIN